MGAAFYSTDKRLADCSAMYDNSKIQFSVLGGDTYWLLDLDVGGLGGHWLRGLDLLLDNGCGRHGE